jgi:hypothetical protein
MRAGALKTEELVIAVGFRVSSTHHSIQMANTALVSKVLA